MPRKRNKKTAPKPVEPPEQAAPFAWSDVLRKWGKVVVLHYPVVHTLLRDTYGYALNGKEDPVWKAMYMAHQNQEPIPFDWMEAYMEQIKTQAQAQADPAPQGGQAQTTQSAQPVRADPATMEEESQGGIFVRRRTPKSPVQQEQQSPGVQTAPPPPPPQAPHAPMGVPGQPPVGPQTPAPEQDGVVRGWVVPSQTNPNGPPRMMLITDGLSEQDMRYISFLGMYLAEIKAIEKNHPSLVIKYAVNRLLVEVRQVLTGPTG